MHVLYALCPINNMVGIDVSGKSPADPSTTSQELSLQKTSIKECPTCAKMKKSGKLSCCARGGAWFKNCGDSDDTKVNHTWTEGIQACSNVVGYISVKSSLQTKFHDEGVMTHAHNNAAPRRINTSRPDSQSYVDKMKVGGCDGVLRLSVCICFVFIISSLQ